MCDGVQWQRVAACGMWQHVAACSGVRRAVCGGRQAAGSVWQAMGGGGNNRDKDAQAAVAYGNVRIFSS